MRKTRVSVCAAIAVAGVSLTFGCHRPPYINSMYTGDGVPVPRPRTHEITVLLQGVSTAHEYAIIGIVEISTYREDRPLAEMLEYAKDEARKLGGDALVDLESGSEAAGVVPIKNLYTGQTIGHAQQTYRIIRAKIAKWI